MLGTGLALAERRLLHGLDGQEFAFGRLQLRLGGIEHRCSLAFGITQGCIDASAASSSDAARPRSRACCPPRRTRPPGAGGAAFELGAPCASRSCWASLGAAGPSRICSMRACSTCEARVAPPIPAECFPALPPGRHLGFGMGERRARCGLLRLGGVQLRSACSRKRVSRRLRLVATDQQARLGMLGLDALEIGSLALAQLARMLQRLLGARRVGACLIVAA